MDQLKEILREALGLELESSDINVLQMMLRAAVVYVVTVLMVRLAKKRFMGRATAFDVILGIMIGSIASRAVTGNAPFLPALAATAVLLGMHWLFSGLALRWHGFGTLVKGKACVLVHKGEVDTTSMQAVHMTEHDLWEDLRGKGISRLDQVDEARLERSGKLSVLKAPSEPKVVDVMVRDDVQTVRIEIRT
ncbi:DUF421 domain-containing protein [Microvirga arabica]|uniref:DUF421 domain-containing protein n=1 Tax=Microvirga arabica TaxID=1128671 RepID=UPI00193A342D|nr:YetF domain-containing protein [Microvirga arabica]MBM1170050.1 DUF421 domain-containing protein [Microvirga arabica]